MMLSGHCLCRKTRFEIEPPLLFVGHCHCESCRRQTASGVTTFIGAANGRWRWLGDVPSVYVSGTGTGTGSGFGRRRFFCAGCGAPAAYQNEAYPEETHFYAALLEDPEAVTPEVNFHAEEALSWAPENQHLPRYDGGST